MGNSTVDTQKEQWTRVADRQGYVLLQHKLSGRHFELHKRVCQFEKQLKSQLQQCEKRNSCGSQVVKAKCFPLSREAMCGDHMSFEVITEHLRTRVCDYKEIPFGQSVFILKQSLSGLKQIKQKFGVDYALTGGMIGFTEDSLVRVWMSEDLSDTVPARPEQDEHPMVLSLLTLMQQATKGGFPPCFIGHLESNLSKPFRLGEALSVVQEYDNLYMPKQKPTAKQAESSRVKMSMPTTLSSSEMSHSGLSIKTKKQLNLNLYRGPGSRL